MKTALFLGVAVASLMFSPARAAAETPAGPKLVLSYLAGVDEDAVEPANVTLKSLRLRGNSGCMRCMVREDVVKTTTLHSAFWTPVVYLELKKKLAGQSIILDPLVLHKRGQSLMLESTVEGGLGSFRVLYWVYQNPMYDAQWPTLGDTRGRQVQATPIPLVFAAGSKTLTLDSVVTELTRNYNGKTKTKWPSVAAFKEIQNSRQVLPADAESFASVLADQVIAAEIAAAPAETPEVTYAKLLNVPANTPAPVISSMLAGEWRFRQHQSDLTFNRLTSGAYAASLNQVMSAELDQEHQVHKAVNSMLLFSLAGIAKSGFAGSAASNAAANLDVINQLTQSSQADTAAMAPVAAAQLTVETATSHGSQALTASSVAELRNKFRALATGSHN